MAVGDVYELVDKQTLKGQECLNVYYYKQYTEVTPESPYPNVAGSLAAAYQASDLYADTLAIQSSEVEHTEIKVRNLFDDADAYTIAVADVGGNSGTPAIISTFEAIPFTLNTANASVRKGAKRIAGINDNFATDGVVTDASLITAIGLVAADMASALVQAIVGGLASWIPVVVKRVRSGTPGNYEYRLPENVGELVFSFLAEVGVHLLLSSQVSRKIGRGN